MFFETRWFKVATTLVVAPILAIALSSFLLEEDILSETIEKIQLHLNFREAKSILEKRNQFVKKNFHLGATFECPGHPICYLKLGKEISAKASDLWRCENIKFNVSQEPYVFNINYLTNGNEYPDYLEIARINTIAKMPVQINFIIKLHDDCPGDKMMNIAIACPPSVFDIESMDQCTYQSVQPVPVYIDPPPAPITAPAPPPISPPPPPLELKEKPSR